MPEGFILIFGAALFAPLLLFAILIWVGWVPRLEPGAPERRVAAHWILPEVPAPVVIPVPVEAAVVVPTRTAA